MEGLFIVISVLFLTIVAPTWLVLHYVHKSKTPKGNQPVDMASIDELLETVDKLTSRVETLEQILDRDHASWRENES